jgi:hypothetical protein
MTSPISLDELAMHLRAWRSDVLAGYGQIGRSTTENLAADLERAASRLNAASREGERMREALGLAETIIRQLPQNGEHWDLLSRFWAALAPEQGEEKEQARAENARQDEVMK